MTDNTITAVIEPSGCNVNDPHMIVRFGPKVPYNQNSRMELTLADAQALREQIRIALTNNQKAHRDFLKKLPLYRTAKHYQHGYVRIDHVGRSRATAIVENKEGRWICPISELSDFVL